MFSDSPAAETIWFKPAPSADGFVDQVLDLRYSEFRENYLLPTVWRPTVEFESHSPGWRMDGMVVPHLTMAVAHLFLRLSAPDGFRFILTRASDHGMRLSGISSDQIAVAAAVRFAEFSRDLPSMRLVFEDISLPHQDVSGEPERAVRGGVGLEDVNESGRWLEPWDYSLTALAAAVRDPYEWLSKPRAGKGTGPDDRRERAVDVHPFTSAEIGLLLRWSLRAVSGTEAAAWERVGVTPGTSSMWTQPPLPTNPGDEVQSLDRAMTVDEALVWARDFGPEASGEARRWWRAGFASVEAGAWRRYDNRTIDRRLDQWAALDDPERRHWYMAAGYTGDEVGDLEAGVDPPTIEQLRTMAALSGYDHLRFVQAGLIPVR